jgi:hypothetical protein
VELYLSGSSTLLKDDERREAERFLAAARTLVGSVTVTSNVDGTQIIVDGELLGTTPLSKPIVVDEGSHEVRFSRPSRPASGVTRTEIVAAGAEIRWVVDLPPDSASSSNASSSASSSPSSSPPSLWAGRLGPVLVGATGAVAATAGGVFVGISLHQANVVEGECGTSCPPSRWEKYRTMQTAGDVLLVTGGSLLVAGVVWWLLQPSGKSDHRTASIPGFVFARGGWGEAPR